MSTCYDCACSKIETDGSDAEELQKTKPVELDELSEETKFRIYKLIVKLLSVLLCFLL